MNNRILAYLKSLHVLGPKAFLESRISSGIYTVNVFGFLMDLRTGTDDEFLLQEMYYSNAYELPKKFIQTIKNKGEIKVIEVGAHIGISTARWLSQIPQGIEITAHVYEPQLDNYKLLCQNTENLTGITRFNEAIAPNGWNITFNTPITHDGIKLMAWSTLDCTSEASPIITTPFDEALQRIGGHADLVIFDAEGSEAFVPWSQCLDKIGLLFIETHEHLFEGSSRTFFQAIPNTLMIKLPDRDENNHQLIHSDYLES